MPNKCLLIEINKVNIDLNSDICVPKATFNLHIISSCCNHNSKIKCIVVKYKALIKNKINMYKRKVRVSVCENGNFWFKIPKNTIGLELEFRVNSHKCKYCYIVKQYHPSQCINDFTADDLSMRMMMKHCNIMSLDTSGIDHMAPIPGEPYVPHQTGPCRTSRAMALIHIAMFEAIISIIGKYESYLQLSPGPSSASVEAAICKASHDVLVWLYPSQIERLNNLSNGLLSQIPNGQSKIDGIQVGQSVASAIINLRGNDNSDIPDPIYGVDYIPSGLVGEWEQDPISMHPKAVGALWSNVTPFAIESANIYRCPPPPYLSSKPYTMMFDEAKALGGDNIITPSIRSDEQTHIGIFWAYDGTPSLCAPARLYNQLLMQVIEQHGMDTLEMCRLFTLSNIALADTCIASWESKYFYKLWRPITAIRRANDDGNDETMCDSSWSPIGAPASNLTNGINFTPPFPTYPSGHASFGGALFQILRRFYNTDTLQFTFISDEFNGVTKDNEGNVRPYLPRTFNNFTHAEDENGESRIYLGIHFKCDKTEGITLGNKVANHIYESLYKPI